jgi:hypothetical protein
MPGKEHVLPTKSAEEEGVGGVKRRGGERGGVNSDDVITTVCHINS